MRGLGLSQLGPALEVTTSVAVACPLCHANLDGRQAHMGLNEPIPVLYFTQLMALAFDLGDKAAAPGKNLVNPRPLL